MLAAHKAETVAEFEQERLQTGNEAVFKFTLLDRAADAEELQAVGAFHHLVGLLGQILRQGEGEVVRLFLNDGAFIRPGLDLVQ